MTISEFPDQPAALLAVQSGKVVCDLTDASTGALRRADDRQRQRRFEIVVDPNPPAGLGLSSRSTASPCGKDNTGLRDAIQKALQSLMDDGTYKTILDHYGLQPYRQGRRSTPARPR